MGQDAGGQETAGRGSKGLDQGHNLMSDDIYSQECEGVLAWSAHLDT